MTLPPHDLPPVALAQFVDLSEEQKVAFVGTYNSRKRSMALMVGLAIVFPIQLFLLGRVGLGILFLLTGGGVGVWYVIEWFLTPKRVRDYNTKVAGDTLARLGPGSGPAAPTEAPPGEEG
jgi:hypothetical protein